MLQTVKDACKFDPKAIDYALSDQIENLDDLIGRDALEVHRYAHAIGRERPPE